MRKPEFTIFIHYKPRIAIAMLDCSGWRWSDVVKKIKEIYHVLVNQFHEKFRSKSPGCRKIKSVFMDVIVCAMPFVAGPKLKRYQVNVLCLHSCTQTNWIGLYGNRGNVWLPPGVGEGAVQNL